MSHVQYVVFQDDGGWAYRVGDMTPGEAAVISMKPRTGLGKKRAPAVPMVLKPKSWTSHSRDAAPAKRSDAFSIGTPSPGAGNGPSAFRRPPLPQMGRRVVSWALVNC